MALYQRKRLSNGQNIGSPAPLPADLVGFLTDADLERLAELNPAAEYAGHGFFRVPDPEPEPEPRRISRIGFLQRIPTEKRIAIRTAAKTDVLIEDFLDLLGATDIIELDHEATVAGLAYLVSENLLTADDVEAIRA